MFLIGGGGIYYAGLNKFKNADKSVLKVVDEILSSILFPILFVFEVSALCDTFL